MLYGPDNRPIKRRKLPPGVDVFWQLPQTEALTAWDVGAAKSAARAHESGDFSASGRMFWAMLTDPRVADGVSKRALALRGMNYTIVPGAGREARTVARKFREAMGFRGDEDRPTGPNRITPPETMTELFGQALLPGLGVGQPEWDRDPKDDWFYPRLRSWEPTLLRYQQAIDGPEDGQLLARTRGSDHGKTVYGETIVRPGDGQWFCFSLTGDRRPWMHGRMLAIWRQWISRLLDMLLWLRFDEVHGMPLRGVEVPMGMRKNPEVQRLYNNIKTIGRDASLLLPQSTDGNTGVKVKLVEAMGKGWESMQAHLLRDGTEITICLTGGTQNTEAVGGNYKGAEEQREIRHEVKGADALAWGSAVTEQLAVPFAVLNGYEPDAAPEVVYDVSKPIDRAAEAKADQEEAKAVQEDVKAWRLMRDNGYEAGALDSYLRSKGHKIPAGRAVEIIESRVDAPAQLPGKAAA